MAFVPSIFLALLLFDLLYALILEAQSFLEVFFTVLAVQVYSEVGGKIVSQLLERTLTVGQRFATYTDEATGNARILKYVLAKLYYDRVLVVDLGAEPYKRLDTVNIPLRMVVQSLQNEVPHPVEITFRNCNRGLSQTIGSEVMGVMQSENNRNELALLVELDKRRQAGMGTTKLYLERDEYDSLRREFERQERPKIVELFTAEDDMVTVLEESDGRRASLSTLEASSNYGDEGGADTNV